MNWVSLVQINVTKEMKEKIVILFFLLLFMLNINGQVNTTVISKDTNTYVTLQQFFRNSFINSKLSSDSICALEFSSLVFYIDSTCKIYNYSLSNNSSLFVHEFIRNAISDFNNLKNNQKTFCNYFLNKNLVYKPICIPMIFNLSYGSCVVNLDKRAYLSYLTLFKGNDAKSNKLTGEYEDSLLEGAVMNTILFRSKFKYQ